MAKFVRQTRPRYWWPVTVHVPSETKPGEFDKQTLKLQFEPMNSEERKAHDEKMAIEHPENDYEVDIKTLLVVTKNWSDIDDEHNQPLGFSEDELVLACQHQWFRVAAMQAYFASLNGPLARVGN